MYNMTTLKERLLSLEDNQTILADVAGVTKQAVTNWFYRDSISKRGARRIADYYKVSIGWVISGNTNSGATYAPQSNAELLGGIDPWHSKTALPDDEVEIPFFTEVELAAGNGMTDTQEHHGFKLRFAKSTLKRQGVEASNAACVKVSGNSMEPVLPDGSTIGIDTAKTTIIDGKMFAIDHDGMLRVKTLYKMPGDGMRLKSFNNDEYPDEIYNQEQSQNIRIIGKVFWYSVLI